MMDPMYNSADFLRPIKDANRDEYILVEFHRVLKNTNLSLLMNLMKHALVDEDMHTIFPNIAVYSKKDIDQLYHASVMFNHPEDMIFALSNEMLPSITCAAFASQFAQPYHFDNSHTTRLEGVLRQLLTTKFVKNIFVFADTFTDEMKRYMALEYGPLGLGDRVIPLEGNFTDCMLQYPQITTVFMSDIDVLFDFYSFYPDRLSKKYIVITDGYGNIEPNANIDDKQNSGVSYRHNDFIIDMHKKKICEIMMAYPYCIPRMPAIPMDLAISQDTQT